MSRRFQLLAIATIVLCFGLDVQPVDARPSRVGQLPNGSNFGCGNCHTNSGGGGPRNAFGTAIENGFLNGSGFSASVNWNSTIAAQDSDGDGVTNGTELGDPDGDGNPDGSITVTNPGDATSFAVQQPVDDTPARPDVAAGDILALVDDETLDPGAPLTLDPGVHEFQLVFGVPIQGSVIDGDVQTDNLDVEVWPLSIADGIADVQLSEDRLALIISIDVAADSFFRIRVGRHPGSDVGSATNFFVGSIDPPTGSVAGTVGVEDGLEPLERGVVLLFSAEALAVLEEDGDIGDLGVDRVQLDDGLAFRFDHVRDGDYIMLARSRRPADAGDRPVRQAFYDVDNDGEPDVVSVSGGEPVEDIEILFQRPPEPEPRQIESLTFDGVAIEEDVINDPVPSGQVEAVVTFTEPLRFEIDDDGTVDPSVDFDIVPSLFGDGGPPEISINEDGTVLTAVLDIPEETTVQFSHGPIRVGSEFRQDYFFGSTDLQDITISGQLIPDIDPSFLDEDVDGRSVGLVVLVEAGAIDALLDSDGIVSFEDDLDGDDRTDASGKAALLTQIVQQTQNRQPTDGPREGDGRGGDQMGDRGANAESGLGIGRFLQNAVRLVVPHPDLSYDLKFVDDGDYLVAAVVNAALPGQPPRRMVGFHDPEGTGDPAVVTVEGGDVENIDLFLTQPLPRVNLRQVRISGVLRDAGIILFKTREGERTVDASNARVADREGNELTLDDLGREDVVTIIGRRFSEDLILADRVILVQKVSPPVVRGEVLAIRQPSADRGGLLTLLSGVFSVNPKQTRIIGPGGRTIGFGDLRNASVVVIQAREAEQKGRPPVAVTIRVVAPGEQLPRADINRGQFVGEIGRVDADRNLIALGTRFGFNNQTAFVDQEGAEITSAEIQPEAFVAITADRGTEGLLRARRVRLVRGADERPPQDVVTATLMTDAGEVDLRRASGVLLTTELRVSFDVPVTDLTLGSVELFVYPVVDDDAPDEDLLLEPRVDGGDLVVDLTLTADTIYEAFIELQNGVSRFGVFTTAVSLPTLEVVSVTPDDASSGVATSTTVSVAFNREIGDASFFLLPEPPDGEVESFEISEDGMSVSADVELEADRIYLVVVDYAEDVDGFVLDELVTSRFSTGDTFPSASVAGNFVLPEGNTLDPVLRNGTGFVALIPSDADVENIEGDEEDRIAAGFAVTQSANWSISGVDAGDYFVNGFVFIEVTDSGRGLGLGGGHVDSDGNRAIVSVIEGDVVEGIEIPVASELELRRSNPEPGASGVKAGPTTLALQFSEPLQENRGVLAIEADIIPNVPGFNRQNVRRSKDDPRRIEAKVVLRDDTNYRLVIKHARGVSGAELSEVAVIPFTTRDQFVVGAISGAITRADDESTVGVVTLGDLDEGARVAEVKIGRDGTYRFRNVPAGRYGVFVNLRVGDRDVRGFYDEDGDGEPDAIALDEGEQIDSIDFAVTIPDAPADPPSGGGSNAGVTLAFDFGSGASSLDIGPGDAFDVAVKATGLTDVIGYDIIVAFDSDKLALQSVVETSGDFTPNALQASGGLGAFIGRVLEDDAGNANTGNLTGAILGPTAQVAHDGEGFTGVLQFVALESFSGSTDLTITSATIQGLDVSDTVTSDAVGTVSVVDVTKTLAISVEPAIITSDGSEAATIQALVLDLDGVLQEADNTTQVSFTITDGTGTLSSTEATAASGVASVSLTSTSSGAVVVEAVADGARPVQTTVIVQAPTIAVGEGPVGPIALDLNTAPGDQSERQTSSVPSAGDLITVDVVATEGAFDALGVSFTLVFDDDALEFQSFAATDVFASAVPISVPKTGAVEISLAFLGGSSSADAGSIGDVVFAVKEGFSGSATVVASFAEWGRTSGTEAISIGSGGATVVIGDASSGGGEPTPDFDGDGTVGFTDFILFAAQFGKNSSSADYDGKFDLDGDDSVGFTDFIIFAGQFGQAVKPALTRPVGAIDNGEARFQLSVTESAEDELVIAVGLGGAEAVTGFGMRVTFDHLALALDSVQPVHSSRFDAVLVRETDSGLVLADMVDEVVSDGGLVNLRFRVLDPTAISDLTVTDVMVSGPGGTIEELAAVRMDALRVLPSDYALSQNFPNPFNPETQIAFQLPEAGDLSLVVYNTLGQQVRVLQRGPAEAGFHRVVWDGRDAVGRSVSSGLYLLRMRAGDFTGIRKMLLLK